MVTSTPKDEGSILQNTNKIATRRNFFFIEPSNTLNSPISGGGKFEWKYLVWATLIVYTKYCHQFHLSCSILIVNRLCSATNTKCSHDIVFVIP
jgi:hypothetical protein